MNGLFDPRYLQGRSAVQPQGLLNQRSGLTPQGQRFQAGLLAAPGNMYQMMNEPADKFVQLINEQAKADMSGDRTMLRSAPLRRGWGEEMAQVLPEMGGIESTILKVGGKGLGLMQRALNKAKGPLPEGKEFTGMVAPGRAGGAGWKPQEYKPNGLLDAETHQAYQDSLAPLSMSPSPDVGNLNAEKKTYIPDMRKLEGMNAAEQGIVKVFGDLDAEGIEWAKNIKNKQGDSAVHLNQKTGFSLDFSTSCPQKQHGKGPCVYCYVEHPRVRNKLWNEASQWKPENINNDYRGEIMSMPKNMLDNLNSNGGMRMFSFSDYRPGVDDANVSWVLEDAKKKGLYIRAITKEPELIKKFGDHPNFRGNISVDNLPRELSNSPTIEEALQWKGDRDNVKIRTVALNEAEAEMHLADPRVDVVTLYHGTTNFDSKGKRHNKLMDILREQNPALIKLHGEEKMQKITDTWQNMGDKSIIYKRVEKKHGGKKMCCSGGKCSKDKTKCGFGLGALIPGVLLLDKDEEAKQRKQT